MILFDGIQAQHLMMSGLKQSCIPPRVEKGMKMDQEDKSEPRQSSTNDYLFMVEQLHQNGSRQAQNQDAVASQKASVNWSREEEQLFCIFWLRKILDPHSVISFKNPLSRRGYYRELSDFLKMHKNEKGQPIVRTPSACKSKYWNYNKPYKKMANSFRKQGKELDFHDVLLERSQGYLKGKYGQELLKLTKELRSTMSKDKPKSQLMKVTQEMKHFQDTECQKLYQDLAKYLKQKREKTQLLLQEEGRIQNE